MTILTTSVEGLHYFHRPWLSLYGNRLQVPSTISEQQTELSLIQRTMPQELMVIIFSYLEPYTLGTAVLVCRQWRILAEHPRLWMRACHEAFALSIPDAAERHKLMATQYRFSWKRMFVHHPHLRFDGIYAARNTYVHTGVVEFTSYKPVHLVSYFRYYRFLPNGTFLYRTSPQVLSKVAKSMAQLPSPLGAVAWGNMDGSGLRAAAQGAALLRLPRNQHLATKEWQQAPVLWGRYVIKGTKVLCGLMYPNSTSTELRCRLAMRSTHPGANNRLDIEAIVTHDRQLGNITDMAPQQQDPDVDVDDPAVKSHNRGMSPCVFVPWDQVHVSPLNQPSHQMDFMIV